MIGECMQGTRQSQRESRRNVRKSSDSRVGEIFHFWDFPAHLFRVTRGHLPEMRVRTPNRDAR